MPAAFVETRFPEDISFGAVGGPQFFTSIATLTGGDEKRIANWSTSRGRWDVAHGLKNMGQLEVLIAFFTARQGRAVGFRFRDWTDYASDQSAVYGSSAQDIDNDNMPASGSMTPVPLKNPVSLGVLGDGATTVFNFQKTYSSGGVDFERRITKLVSGAVRVFVNGIEQVAGITLDLDAGTVTFDVAPADTLTITADFLFDVPVRFDSDEMPVSLIHFDTADWGQILVVEVRIP